MKKLSTAILSLAATLLLFGCATTVPTEYVPGKPVVKTAKVDTLFMRPVIDSRSAEATLPYDPNSDPMIMIPFLPYSKAILNPMVRYNFFQDDLRESLQRLFVKDLRTSGICQTIEVADQYKPLLKPSTAAYRLTLDVKRARWTRYLTAYGLSYPGTFLWIIGLPVSFGHVELAIDVELRDPYDKLLGKTRLTRKARCTEWLYDQINYQPAVSEDRLTELFPSVANDLREFLVKTLP